MGTTEQTDEWARNFYNDVCSNLNMDQIAAEEAWSSYSSTKINFTLEGDQRHWLCCALYAACRRSRGASIAGSGSEFESNGVPFMRLLKLCNISLVQFLEKAKKWSDMANVGAEFKDRLNQMERKFAVSMVIYKKYRLIYTDIFMKPEAPANENQKGSRPRKPKNAPCTPAQVFDFTWTLFVSSKSEIPDILDDLVNSYHLLLVCLNFVFGNSILADRRDLINPQFMGLPHNFLKTDYEVPDEPPSILSELCRSHDGILHEAEGIQSYWFNKLIEKHFEKEILRGNAPTDGGARSGLLEPTSFEANFKAVNKAYEDFVLNKGDFDERAFLSSEEEFTLEVGSPTKLFEVNDCMQNWRIPGMSSFTKMTPLTGHYLGKTETNPRVSPISTAIEAVIKLQAMLKGREAKPSATLNKIYDGCPTNPQAAIEKRISKMGEHFITAYTRQTKEIPGSHIEFAKKRLQLGTTLFYMLLEQTTLDEQQKKGNGGIPALLENDLCQKALFAVCLEVVLFSYNSQRKFPWILDTLDLEPYYFYKVIEVVVIATLDKLSRGTIKNLQFIEEQILESFVWNRSSPLWKAIDALKGSPLPTYEEVKLPDDDGIQALLSPAGSNLGSPIRNLISGQSLLTTSTGARVAINIATVQGGDGQRYIPISVQSGGNVIIQGQSSRDGSKPKVTGALAMFLRKFYYLASTRLKALCKMLNLGEEDVKKIWTNLEFSITHHSYSLLRDRHLDQLIMCAIYVVCKVTSQNREFRTIMHHYRDLPQSASHVYRKVLLRRREDGSEERGDLIIFYNNVYVQHMRNFSVKFSDSANPDSLLLSPLPTPKIAPMSPKVQINGNKIYISTLDRSSLVDSPIKAPGTLQYLFSRSPNDTLRQINKLVSSPVPMLGKRTINLDDTETTEEANTDVSPAKKPTAVVRKIQHILDERLSKSQE
ncbi:retinoblastoma-like protein 1 isoform X2 [Neocloeon triangulifer]|uniref:retinoblastoma-like protein 1 isoform X2 n=1 Tax=Neocloeon triangulifer TaxID=2078957 RepID=UPI00286F0917|nr:retinoblastoma-like protein 1 isoform X2 [Neocloeon triangulifer]